MTWGDIKQKFKDLFLLMLVVLVFVLGYFYLQDNPILENSLGTIDPSVDLFVGTTTSVIIKNEVKKQPYSPSSQPQTDEMNNRANLPMMENNVYLIYYFDDGFYPKAITIRQGSPVRYINKSEGAMRVFATDQNNLTFKELNQSKTVGNGGTYDFTFSRAGIWSYYNYNNKVHTASVLVY